MSTASVFPVTMTEATSNPSSSQKKTLVANGWAALAFSRISTALTPGSRFRLSLASGAPPGRGGRLDRWRWRPRGLIRLCAARARDAHEAGEVRPGLDVALLGAVDRLDGHPGELVAPARRRWRSPPPRRRSPAPRWRAPLRLSAGCEGGSRTGCRGCAAPGPGRTAIRLTLLVNQRMGGMSP